MTTTVPVTADGWDALLEHPAAVARQAGIRSFAADTLADNGLMQRVFTDAGFQLERRGDLDVTHARIAELDLNPVTVDTHSLTTVDAKIRVTPIGADHDLRHDPLLRRLC